MAKGGTWTFIQGKMSCDVPDKECEKPTAIRLSSFNVVQQDGQNLIVWITGTEIETEGFHILRSTSPGGPYSRITPAMIASTGSPFSGGRYSFVDTAVEDGNSYYYKLEEVDTRENLAQYGPVAAVAEFTPTPARGIHSHQGGKEDVAAGYSLQNGVAGSSDQVASPSPSPQTGEGSPLYTIVAYADGPAKFLSGEEVDTVKGCRDWLDVGQLSISNDSNEQLASSNEEKPIGGVFQPRRESRDNKDVIARGGSGETISKTEIASGTSSPHNDKASPESIRFRIIDADGNEVAVASLEAIHNPPSSPFSKGGIEKHWDGKRILLTWYATEPVKGFHILRGTKKDGPYQKITKIPIPYLSPSANGKIFRYTYTDRKVQKGKDYYYRVETISEDVASVN